jgi:hypothetical protein
MDMVWSAMKELTEQVARDRKWKMLEKVLDLQGSWQTKEREKITESLQMVMTREAKKKRKRTKQCPVVVERSHPDHSTSISFAT